MTSDNANGDSRARSVRERLQREQPVMGGTENELKELFSESAEMRRTYRAQLQNLATYSFFIGYPRTGHTLIGALLDAHPDLVFAHELDVIMFQEAGFDREQIEYLLIENARLVGEAGRIWGPHAYTVTGQWQGRFRTLKVLGDKKGGQTTTKIAQRPQRLQNLLSIFNNRIKFIHVVRNPFDTITYFYQQWGNRQGYTLEQTAKAYFGMARANAMIRKHVGSERAIDIWHEDLIANPRKDLTRICEFLDVDVEDSYLTACASIVWENPRRSRDAVEWTSQIIQSIEHELKKFDFLSRYSFSA
jgi:hypothetical protein